MWKLGTVLVLLQAKLEEMDKKVRDAIRRRNREDRLLFVALLCVVLFALWFLITKFILWASTCRHYKCIISSHAASCQYTASTSQTTWLIYINSDIETLIYTLSKTYGPVHLSIIQILKVTSQLVLVARVLQLQKIPANRSLFLFMMSKQQGLSSCQLCLTVQLNSQPKYHLAYTLYNIRSRNSCVFYLTVNRMCG